MTTLETTTQTAVILQPGEGTLIDVLGNPMLVRLGREVTDNKFWLSEYTVRPNYAGPPPHIHRRTHEFFYVLEGELGIMAGDQETVLGPGGLAMVPPGIRPTFYNKSSAPCRFLGLTSPGDLGAYLEALPGVVEKYGFPPPADISAALAEQYDGGIFSTAP